MFLPHPRVKVSIVGSLRDREVACSASDRRGSNFESCVWKTVSSQSSHHPQKVLLAQFSLYVHKGGLKPVSFHFFDINLIVAQTHSCLICLVLFHIVVDVMSFPYNRPLLTYTVCYYHLVMYHSLSVTTHIIIHYHFYTHNHSLSFPTYNHSSSFK